MNQPKIIAVDFDGCLVTNRFPDIGEPIPETITALKREQDAGAKVILWTCRTKEQVEAAVAWCAAQGIQLDAVNQNLPEIVEAFGGDTVKVFANEYWDDRARLMPSPDTQRDIVLRKAVSTYGQNAQSDMMVEEMSELTKAILKLRRAALGKEWRAARDNLLEEMADVCIMLDQMEIMYGETRSIEATKVERLATRLKQREDKK